MVPREYSIFVVLTHSFVKKIDDPFNFVVFNFQGGWFLRFRYVDGKQTHFTFILVPSEILNYCGFNPYFPWKKKVVTYASFVVPIFQGDDLCDIDGKTDAFHFRLSVSKRNLEMGKKYIFYH